MNTIDTCHSDVHSYVCEIHSSVEVRISLGNNIELRNKPQPVDEMPKFQGIEFNFNQSCQGKSPTKEKMMTKLSTLGVAASYLELRSRSYPPALGHHAQSWENP